MMKKMVVLIGAAIWFQPSYEQTRSPFTTNDYIVALKHATDVMVNDATSPVAAARYYSYINLAANETAALFNKDQQSFSAVAKGFKKIIIEDSLLKKSDSSLATILVVYKSASRLLPSGYILKRKTDSLQNVAKKRKLSAEKVYATIRLADEITAQILKYAYGDGFVKLSGLKRFTPSNGDEFWQPTPPGFIPAIEPNWSTLRTFILDSCSQFACAPPAKYSTDTASAFFKELMEVYNTGKNQSKEQSDIAMFWDCNPFALQQIGHLEFGIKKNSPGGHWIGITGIACKKHNLSISQTAYVHTMVSMGLADAFISCWDDKYKYNRVRPITAIKKLIDQTWLPLLQTPPFPEYTSGHSVISTTAAVILTHFFGDNFSFKDDTEIEFGLSSRTFKSFITASREAAISRLYGGIHFRDAIENGIEEGEKVGNYIIKHSPGMQTNYMTKNVPYFKNNGK